MFFWSGFDVLFKKKLNFLYYRSCMSSSRVSFAAKRTYAAPPHIIDDTEDDMPTPPARQQPPPIFDLNTMEWIFNNIILCSKCLWIHVIMQHCAFGGQRLAPRNFRGGPGGGEGCYGRAEQDVEGAEGSHSGGVFTQIFFPKCKHYICHHHGFFYHRGFA